MVRARLPDHGATLVLHKLHTYFLRLLLLLLSCRSGQVHRLQLQFRRFTFAFAVQLHHVPATCVVEGGRHSGPAVEVLSACAGDRYSLAEERALGADFLVESLQILGCSCVSFCKRPLVEVPGLLVGFGGTLTKLVAYAEIVQCMLTLEF